MPSYYELELVSGDRVHTETVAYKGLTAATIPRPILDFAHLIRWEDGEVYISRYISFLTFDKSGPKTLAHTAYIGKINRDGTLTLGEL